MSEETKEIATIEPTMSERFAIKVATEFGSGVGDIVFTKAEQRMAQNYFISLDASLKAAEQKRYEPKNKVPITWANVNMESLSRDVVSSVRVGLDALEKNHINMIPYLNKKTNKYDIGFIPGYRGIEIKARKYGLDVPDSVTVEVVCKTDTFKMYKKDRQTASDSFDFQIENPFDRGEIVGGFYFHEYVNHPEKNKLVVLSLKEILKRKPAYASAEFWGGEKDKWENGKKVGKEETEGWYDQMVYKTIYRAAYSNITIDSTKIDDDFRRLQAGAERVTDGNRQLVYEGKANQTLLDIEPDSIDSTTGEVLNNKGNGQGDEMSEEEIAAITASEAAEGESSGPGFEI